MGGGEGRNNITRRGAAHVLPVALRYASNTRTSRLQIASMPCTSNLWMPWLRPLQHEPAGGSQAKLNEPKTSFKRAGSCGVRGWDDAGGRFTCGSFVNGSVVEAIAPASR